MKKSKICNKEFLMVLSTWGEAVGHGKTPRCLRNVPEPSRGCEGANFAHFWPETSQNPAAMV